MRVNTLVIIHWPHLWVEFAILLQDDDDDDDEVDSVIMDQDGKVSTLGPDISEAASMFFQKLQNLTKSFESKNKNYQAMEERSEKLRKVRVLPAQSSS